MLFDKDRIICNVYLNTSHITKMNTKPYVLQGEELASVAFALTGIAYRNIIGRTFSFTFEEGVLLGTILAVYVDLKCNIEISVSNPNIGWNKKITSLKWNSSEEEWRLFYDSPAELRNIKNFEGEFKLL